MSKTHKSALGFTVVTMRAISFTPLRSASALADLSGSELARCPDHDEAKRIIE